MPRASRGFSDCHVQHTPGTGALCLRQLVPLHHPLRPNKLLGGAGDPACSAGASLGSCHPPCCSQPDLVLLQSHYPAQGRGTGCKLPSNLLPRPGFLLVLHPQPHGILAEGGRLLTAAPDVRGCAGDITLQAQICRVRGLTERNWSHSEGWEFGHSTVLFQ